MDTQQNKEINEFLDKNYEFGFTTEIESETLPPGINEDVIRIISSKKNEPEFLLNWRLKAFAYWKTLKTPDWSQLNIDPIDYQSISYFSQPKQSNGPKSLDEVDPKLLETYEKLGIPLHERAQLAGVAVDAVFDSVSVVTTFKDKLAEAGVIFCSFSSFEMIN